MTRTMLGADPAAPDEPAFDVPVELAVGPLRVELPADELARM